MVKRFKKSQPTWIYVLRGGTFARDQSIAQSHKLRATDHGLRAIDWFTNIKSVSISLFLFKLARCIGFRI
jgi:hypothetical protein